jgi:hypothetical protein
LHLLLPVDVVLFTFYVTSHPKQLQGFPDKFPLNGQVQGSANTASHSTNKQDGANSCCFLLFPLFCLLFPSCLVLFVVVATFLLVVSILFRVSWTHSEVIEGVPEEDGWIRVT